MKAFALHIAGVLTLGAVLWGCQMASQPTPADADTPDAAALEAVADTSLQDPDARTRFAQVMDSARTAALHTKPIGEVMVALGTQFMEAPYLAGTLDESDEEMLVIRFDGYDCVTYVETMLAMARGVLAQDYSFNGFARRLEEQRYRHGQMSGYCSRLHYFSEWLYDNAERGLVAPLTADLGGVALPDTLDFMSTHRDAYARFATNDSLYGCVQAMEADIEGRPVYYVPQDQIASVYDQIEAGDIIGLATSIDGLDIAHTGLAYAQPDGRIGLLHASTSGGVKVSPDLQAYVRDIGHQIGIVVARPQPPAAP